MRRPFYGALQRVTSRTSSKKTYREPRSSARVPCSSSRGPSSSACLPRRDCPSRGARRLPCATSLRLRGALRLSCVLPVALCTSLFLAGLRRTTNPSPRERTRLPLRLRQLTTARVVACRELLVHRGGVGLIQFDADFAYGLDRRYQSVHLPTGRLGVVRSHGIRVAGPNRPLQGNAWLQGVAL